MFRSRDICTIRCVLIPIRCTEVLQDLTQDFGGRAAGGSTFPSAFPYSCQEATRAQQGVFISALGWSGLHHGAEGFPLIPSARAAALHALLRSQPVEHLAGPRSKRSHVGALEAGFFAKSGFISREVHALGYLNAWSPFPLVRSPCSRKMEEVSKKGTFLLIFVLHQLRSGGQGTIPAAWASCSPL